MTHLTFITLNCHILATFHTILKRNFHNIKLVFNSFKIKNYFSYKDPIPNDLTSFLVYEFTCARCSSRNLSLFQN